MVEGPEYSTNLSGFDKLPVHLPVPNRLVYSPHAYFDQKHPFATLDEMKQGYEARVGYLMHAQPAVPLWIGEFGTCQDLNCGANSAWFRLFIRFLEANSQLSWSYWPLNGNQSSGMTRKYDAVETYGLLSPDYRSIAAPQIVEPRPAGNAVEISIDTDGRQLHELIQRPFLGVLDQAINGKRPGCEVDVRRSVRIEHRPLLSARLPRRHSVLAPRVRADDDVRVSNLFRLARLGRLVVWILN